MATRIEQLTDAMLRIAKDNHYMVGLVERVTADELDGAEQALIRLQNDTREGSGLYKRCELALDLIELERRRLSR